MRKNEIRCCGYHLNYPTPVISTFKWNHKEFWCPHCGTKYEFFDGFKYYERTAELAKRLDIFTQMAEDFLTDKTSYYELYRRAEGPPSEGSTFQCRIDESNFEVTIICAHCPTIIFKEPATFDVSRQNLQSEKWQQQMFDFLTEKAAHLIHKGKLVRVCSDCLKTRYAYAP